MKIKYKPKAWKLSEITEFGGTCELKGGVGIEQDDISKYKIFT